MSKLLLHVGSLLIILSLCTCRTARQGSQEAPAQTVVLAHQDSCLQLNQKIIAYWTFDTTDHIYYLRSDSVEMSVQSFYELFSGYKNCFLGKKPSEAVKSIGEPTRILPEKTRTQEYNVYLFHFSLVPTRKYRKDAYLKIQDRNDTLSVFIDGDQAIFIW